MSEDMKKRKGNIIHLKKFPADLFLCGIASEIGIKDSFIGDPEPYSWWKGTRKTEYIVSSTNEKVDRFKEKIKEYSDLFNIVNLNIIVFDESGDDYYFNEYMYGKYCDECKVFSMKSAKYCHLCGKELGWLGKVNHEYYKDVI